MSHLFKVKMTFLPKQIFFHIVFITILHASALAHAQVLIEEGKIKLTLKPEQNYEDAVTVHNTSDQKITVKAYWEDFEYIEPFDGSKKFLPAKSTEASCVDWVEVNPTTFTMGPNSTKVVKYSVQIPPEKQGGYYGVLFFEKSGQQLRTKTGLRIVSRVGSLFFLETENKNKKTEITGLDIVKNNITGSIKNQGDVIVVAQGIYYVMSEDGLLVDSGELSTIYLPPLKEAQFDIGLIDNLPNGEYDFVIVFDLEQGDAVIQEYTLTIDESMSVELNHKTQ